MRLFVLFGLLLWLEVVAGEGDYYTVLGIKKGATLKEIKKAFRKHINTNIINFC